MKNRRRNWYERFAERAFTFRVDLLGRSGARATVALALCLFAGAVYAAGPWQPLRKDGLHDPKGPGIGMLQEPGEALSKLPPDYTGNMVRWVEAIQKGHIKPRPSLKPGVAAKLLDQDILLDLKGGMPIVLFPHLRHTQWLDCSNCHDGVFKMQAGSTKLSMFQILAGEQCGICHGAVSFPLTECQRCHSILRPGQVERKQQLPLPDSHVPPGQ